VSTAGGAAAHLTASSVVAETGGGILHTLTVNKGAASATVTLYDGTSTGGAVIAVIDASAAQTFTYDAVLRSGLYIGVSGSIDVTAVILPPASLTT
jgi:hypothetical protein